MTRWFFAVLALAASSPAFAATTWTCTRDFCVVQEAYYECVGSCTGSGNYTTGGGDAIGSAATAKATALTLCGSGNQTLVDLMTTCSPDNAQVCNAVCGFDMVNFKYKCSVQGTAGAGNAMVETSMAAVPTNFRFRAVCK